MAGLLACQRMTVPGYNAASMANRVSDNVLNDLLSFSYPRIAGGPIIAYNNIDAGTQNVKCGTGVAKRDDGSEGGNACTIQSSSLVSSTLTSTITTITSTFASTTSSSLPALFTFGSPDDQCESVIQPESCRCLCTIDEDCAPCESLFDVYSDSTYVNVCNTKIGLGCCECQFQPS